MHLDQSIKDRIVELMIGHYPKTIAIYLFGSFATGDATENSDIDVAFLLPYEKKDDPVERWYFSQEMAIQLRQKVDLISLNQASTVFRFIIISQSVLLYSANEYERQSFEMVAYSMYLRFNEERKSILEDIKKRGSVFK